MLQILTTPTKTRSPRSDMLPTWREPRHGYRSEGSENEDEPGPPHFGLED